MEFYGLVTKNQSVYKPFCKTESFKEAEKIKNNTHNVNIIKYTGYKRHRNGRVELVIKDIF